MGARLSSPTPAPPPRRSTWGRGSGRLAHAAARGFEAVRQNARPFLLIQGVAVILAIAYYLVPGAPSAMTGIAALKRAGGLPLAALCNAVAGAILPELARVATGRRRTGAGEMAFQLLFFAALGVYVDGLYRALGTVWGNAPDLATVGKKVLFDQLVSSPLVTIPFSTFAFVWKDSGFSLARTRNAFRAQGGFLVRYLPTLVTCWGFWAPVLVAVYAMPADLQFPLFLAAQAAWTLLLLHLNER